MKCFASFARFVVADKEPEVTVQKLRGFVYFLLVKYTAATLYIFYSIENNNFKARNNIK